MKGVKENACWKQKSMIDRLCTLFKNNRGKKNEEQKKNVFPEMIPKDEKKGESDAKEMKEKINNNEQLKEHKLRLQEGQSIKKEMKEAIVARDKITKELKIKVLQMASRGQIITEQSE